MKIWQLSMDMASDIYSITKSFPFEERFGLTNQLRRASVSIPSNIAEGSSRSEKDFERFLRISLGSIYELETQISLSENVGYCDRDKASRLLDKSSKLKRMILGYMQSLQKTS